MPDIIKPSINVAKTFICTKWHTIIRATMHAATDDHKNFVISPHGKISLALVFKTLEISVISMIKHIILLNVVHTAMDVNVGNNAIESMSSPTSSIAVKRWEFAN